MYRRLKDEAPMYLYYWDGSGERSCAGWYVAKKPGKQSQDDYHDFWNTESALPANGKGECGGSMQAQKQLDGPALEALAALPEKRRSRAQAAFTAACSGAAAPEEEEEDEEQAPPKGVPEEEAAEASADVAEAKGEALTPWQRRRAQLAATEATEKPSHAAETSKEAVAGEEPAAEAAEDAGADKDAMETTEAVAEEVLESAAEKDAEAVAAEAEGEDAVEEPADEAAAEAEENAEPMQAAEVDEADRESLPSHCSFTTGPGKTVPGGDRGESMAPTQFDARADSSVDRDGAEQENKQPADSGLGSLTAEALRKHTEALARAQAEAYAATFASAKTTYAKSVAGMSIAGRSIAGKSIAGASIAGKSIAGRSIAGRSVAGRSIAASGIAPSEKTFRTHMTTREMLVGPSQMREIMRSVSPISEPGVAPKRRRRARDVSPCSVESDEVQRKKRKKDKKEKKANKRAVSLHPRKPSPSHYALQSPTPFAGPSVTPFERTQDPSAPPEEVIERKKKKPKEGKKKGGKRKTLEEEAEASRMPSESAEPVKPKEGKKRKKSRSPTRKRK